MYYILNLPRKNSVNFKEAGRYKTVEDLKDILTYNRFTNFEKPYIFTSIHCVDQNGKPHRITQTVEIKGQEIMVSPEKLYQELTATVA